jgi:NADH:ubiquinone oxidoreductase subunit 6 (subunit J)
MKFISSLFKTFYYFLECALERLNSIPKGLKNVTITLCIILIFLPSNTIIFLNSDVNFNLLFTITNLVENSPFVYNILNNLLLSHTNSLLELELWDEKTLHLIHNVFVYTITSEGFLDWLKDVNMFELKNNKFFENLFLTTFNLDFLDYENIYFLTEGGLYWDIFTTNFNFFAIKTRIINEIFFINFFSIFLKKKIILFMFFNVILILSMAYNLYKLYDSTNLIYALLHFLYFAVLSGLLILLWGSTYLAFCIILIYGAAIPVLALYIIMLVNVDLIQRLFFFEHLNKEKVTEKYKGMLVLIFFIFYCCFCFK